MRRFEPVPFWDSCKRPLVEDWADSLAMGKIRESSFQSRNGYSTVAPAQKGSEVPGSAHLSYPSLTREAPRLCYIHVADAETHRPIAEILEELEALDAEAAEANAALRS